jgi:hypothetical protein
LIVALYFWRIKPSVIPQALIHMGMDRFPLRKLRTNSEISFFKLLGTGKGKSFTPKDADATRWGLLVCLDESKVASFDNSKIVSNWRNFAISESRTLLKPISSHGSWGGKNPFLILEPVGEPDWEGRVGAITRARIRVRENFRFWRAVPPVTGSLLGSPGLDFAIGIGEAPIGLQGTFSIWSGVEDLKRFAFEGAEHRSAIMATHRHDWYAEELFARLAIIDQRGDLKAQ